MHAEIGILDLGMGNLGSLYNAIYEAGFDPVFLDAADSLDTVTHLFLPGVGNFAAAMAKLLPAADALRAYVGDGRPLMGICIGMQLLAETGAEGGGDTNVGGLGCIAGTVERIAESDGLRVPHIGWNEVEFCRGHPILDAVKTDRDFYFVHSYTVKCAHEEDVLGTTKYGTGFTSVVARGNVTGLQFHPEKSQMNGLRLIENFCHWDGAD